MRRVLMFCRSGRNEYGYSANITRLRGLSEGSKDHASQIRSFAEERNGSLGSMLLVKSTVLLTFV